ncbi:MAG: ATP synthase F1 subunit delta [Gemmatimonadota bacterium]|nr:ATP synthase F1 subunit delta [Gemmatimonadota bacterium]
MREPTIARNYAEALVSLATKADDLEGWGTMITGVADAIESDPKLRVFLDMPRISAARKNEILGGALQDRLPRLMVRFIQAIITHRRQHLLSQIAIEYHLIVDEVKGRVHARVQVARDPDEATRQAIVKELNRVVGKRVVPHFSVRPEILGGAIVRVGDTVMDGSVRRRLGSLRARMMRG